MRPAVSTLAELKYYLYDRFHELKDGRSRHLLGVRFTPPRALFRTRSLRFVVKQRGMLFARIMPYVETGLRLLFF